MQIHDNNKRNDSMKLTAAIITLITFLTSSVLLANTLGLEENSDGTENHAKINPEIKSDLKALGIKKEVYKTKIIWHRESSINTRKCRGCSYAKHRSIW